jgi:hypothetical protein
MKRAITVFLALAVAYGVSSAYDPEAMEQGRKAARYLNDTLRKKLVSSIEDNGPSAGVVVCLYQAQALSAEVERDLSVRVKRTSLKIRNPKNAPDDYEKDLLSRLADRHRKGKLPSEILEDRWEGGKRVYRYAKPLVVDSFCLTCHGKVGEIPPDVRRELEIRYPGDDATGYEMGDLRGIVSVTIPGK